MLALTALAVMAATPDVRARQTPALRPLAVTQIDDRPVSGDIDAPRRLSVSFAEPAPLRDVLLLLVKDTPFSLALDPDVDGTFLGELKDVSLRQAIESVLAPRALDYEIRGTLVHVFARRTETRLYDLNIVNVQRAWRKTISAADGTELASRAGTTDPFDEVEKGIESLLSPAGKAHVDRRAGLAQVTDYADRLDRVGIYLEALHVRSLRQVRLQARVLDVAVSPGDAIDWRAVRQALGVGDRPAAGLAIGDPRAFEAALAAQGDVRVLATPDVVTMNNEPAVMHIAAPDASSLTLTVMPQVSADDNVVLSVSPSWTEPVAPGSAAAAGNATVQISESDTVSRIAAGQTLVVSGLLHGVPQPSPVASAPRGRHAPAAAAVVRVRREMVVLITPTVVSASRE